MSFEKRIFKVAIMGAMFVSLTGCDKIKSYISEVADTALDKQIELFSNQVSDIRKSQEETEAKLNAIDMKVRDLDVHPALLSSTDTGYSIAQTVYGPFPVIIDDIKPYLDGYKIRLKIGNISAANFSGAKITLVAGSDENFTHNSTASINSTAVFVSGTYTPVEVTIQDTKAENMHFVSIGLEFSQLSLGFMK